MTYTLFIQLPSPGRDQPCQVEWAIFAAEKTDQGQKVAGANNCLLADVMAQTKDYPDKLIVALVPGSDIVQTHITIPAGQKRHLQRTLPFLVEEEIATPIEEMHLCLGPMLQDQAVVSVVSHHAMQYWQQLLTAAQIEADWLLADSTALTLGNGLEILLDVQVAHFYCPPQPVINTEFDNLSFIADTLLDQLSAAQTTPPVINTGKLWVSQQLSATKQAAAAALAAQFEVAGIALQQQPITKRFDFFCAQLQAHLSQGRSDVLINLLSGNYRGTSKRQNQGAPKWRLLAVAVVACMLIKLILDIGSGLYLNQQSEQFDKQINALYHDLFPQDKRIVNVKVQMQNHLKGQVSSSGSSFMPLFGYMAEAINNLDDSKNVQLQQLRYNDKTRTLLVDIDVRAVQQLEKIKQLIEARNVKVSILSANKERQWIKGRVRLAL